VPGRMAVTNMTAHRSPAMPSLASPARALLTTLESPRASPSGPAGVAASARLCAASSGRPCPERALRIGRQRSATENHGRGPCPPSCRISPSRAERAGVPSWR
jgi:hypothetical protein